MNIKQQKEMLEVAKQLFDQKGISQDETQTYLEEIFVKAFERDRRFNSEEPIPESQVEAKVDLEKGNIDVKRTWTVVKEVEEENRLIHLSLDDELLEGKDIKEGDTFVEVIDLLNIPYGKAQHIKQLLIQKTRESEKMKLYDQFKDRKGELVNAKVFKRTEKFSILEYEGVSIFMPASENMPTDTFKIGDNILVYIIEIEKVSKDAQIIGSRSNPNFVRKLIEREIDDVQDGVVKIEGLARLAGAKTKISVSSTLPEVDPVGSIIGVKGKKIAPIIELLQGERIDIIKYEEDIHKYIAEALLPAEIEGVRVEEPSIEGGKKQVTVIVTKDNFLPALGKKGINVMLAARLTGVKIDVKTIEEAETENIEWIKVLKTKPIMKQGSFSKRTAPPTDFELEDFNIDKLDDIDDQEDMYNKYLDRKDEQ